jgi:hypothetical protein
LLHVHRDVAIQHELQPVARHVVVPVCVRGESLERMGTSMRRWVDLPGLLLGIAFRGVG